MKKVTCLFLALLLCVGLCACGGNAAPSDEKKGTEPTETQAPPETYYAVGDTVSTNLFTFTLDEAQLAIALNNTHGDDFCTPKDYNAQVDKDNPYVAATGHTYVAFTYTVENISRASEEFHDGNFVTVVYDGTEYSRSMEDCACYYYQDYQYYYNGRMYTDEAGVWHSGPSGNMYVGAAEKESRRAYADISVETASLTDGFLLRVSVPSSEGKVEFTYQIPAGN